MFFILCVSVSACMYACTLYSRCLGRCDKGIIALRIIAAGGRAPPFGYCERSPEGQLTAKSYLQFQNVILTKHAWPRQLAWIISLSHHCSNTETGAGYTGFLASEITCTRWHEDFCQIFLFLTPGSSFPGAFRKSSEARPLASHNYLWKTREKWSEIQGAPHYLRPLGTQSSCSSESKLSIRGFTRNSTLFPERWEFLATK